MNAYVGQAPTKILNLGITGFLLKLVPYVRARRLHFALFFGGVLLQIAFSELVPISFKYLIDTALVERNEQALVLILSGLAIGVVLISIAGFFTDRLYARLAGGVLSDLRSRMFEHLQRLSMDFYARSGIGNILSRFSTDHASVEYAMNTAIPWGLLEGIECVVTSMVMFMLDWRLACLAMLAWPLCLIAPRVVGPKASVATRGKKTHEAMTVTAVQESIAARGVIKAYCLEKPSIAGFLKRNTDLLQASVRASSLGALIDRSAEFGILILQVLIIGVGSYMAIKGQLTIGTLASFQALFMMLASSLSYVTQYTPMLFEAGGGMQRIQELLQEVPLVSDADRAEDLPPFSDRIEFRNVSFGYAPGRTDLTGVNLTIMRGSRVAFVGGSGSGKSTMLNLLMRFYDPAVGSVLVDGRDLRSATQHSLRSQFGTVFQDNYLFSATLRENIRVGNQNATDEQVEAAASASEIDGFIRSLPMGYETVVGEGAGRLSGGQRQRIAIARAILRDPPILVLDEFTSALDPDTESAVNATLARIARTRTVISVSHRLTSIVDFDRIFVFDGGKIVEQGDHRSLLAAGGAYAKMWSKQSGFTIPRENEYAAVHPDRLRSIPLLENLAPHFLAEMSSRFVTEQVPEGRTIIYEGDSGDKFYILVRGRAVVTKASPEGGEPRKLAVLQDGDHFGEIALVENRPRTATVQAETPCIYVSLARQHFMSLLDRAPDVRARIAKSVADRTKAQEYAEHRHSQPTGASTPAPRCIRVEGDEPVHRKQNGAKPRSKPARIAALRTTTALAEPFDPPSVPKSTLPVIARSTASR